MEMEWFDEMERLLDLACAGPDTADGRAALKQAASMWREYMSGLRKALAFSTSVSDDERRAVADVIAPYLQRCAAAIADVAD